MRKGLREGGEMRRQGKLEMNGEAASREFRYAQVDATDTLDVKDLALRPPDSIH